MTRKEFFDRLIEIALAADIPVVYWNEDNTGGIKRNDKHSLVLNLQNLSRNYSDKKRSDGSARSSWQLSKDLFTKYKIDIWTEFKDDAELIADLKEFFKSV